MTAKTWLLAVAVGATLAGSGCVSCCHQAAKACLQAGPDCEVPLADRQHVYAVLLNGASPTGLCELRDKLAALGFAKIYCGDIVYGWWFEYEMRRVAREEPSARFVLVGYDVSCPAVVGMARAAIKKGLPVDSVYLLDPVGAGADTACGGGCRTVTVQKGPDCEPTACANIISVPDAGHFSLPAHPTTVAAVYAGLKASAERVVHPMVYAVGPGGGLVPPPVGPPAASTLPPGWQPLESLSPSFPPLTPPTPEGDLPGRPTFPVPQAAQPLPQPRAVREVP
jgi:hypothetical protein